MAIQPSEFISQLSPPQLDVVLGMTGDMIMSFSNTSALDAGYNLSVEVTLPNGVSYDSSTVAPTSIVNDPSGTIILKWTNIKDLSPQELNYVIGLTLKSDETFRVTGNPVPLDTVITGIDMVSTVDTLPRGADDPGNEVRTNLDSSTLLPLRYNLTKKATGKIVKGAGTLIPPVSEDFPFEYTLVVENNSRSSSTVTLIDNLPNGVRYLGNLNVSGPDSVLLSAPTVILPSIAQDFTTLDWGSVTLSANSVNTITFDAAIWDKYTVNGVENSGAVITHMTPLENSAEIDGLSGLVEATSITNAMDATIRKSVSPVTTDVGGILNYTLTYEINQYYDVDDFTIIDITADGQTFNNDASIAPASFVENPDGTTTIEWQLGDLTASTTGAITFSTTVDATYFDGDPVSSNDMIDNSVSVDGTNATLGTQTPDSSASSTGIAGPSIEKVVNGYYYNDATTLKPYNVAAPGDFVDFTITFDSLGLTADQMGVTIDEYAPLNMGPLVDTIPVTYGGTLGTSFSPVTVSPNGLRWTLGDLPGGNLWTATFRVPVENTVFVGSRNNLAKLSLTNSGELASSDRDQVEVNFGEPEITFEKTVDDTTNPVRPGEVYTYSITVSNPQNVDGTVTDAFNMQLTDVIPTGMTYTGTSSVTGSGTADPPVFVGQDVSMLITQLAPDETITLNYEVVVDIGVAAGLALTNNAVLTRPYSQADNSFQYPGDPFTAEITKNVVELVVEKTADITDGLVGDDINYTLTITIPANTAVYSLQVTDTLPIGQTYIGPATVEIPPAPPVAEIPAVAGNTVTFASLDLVAGAVDLVIEYNFVARITSGLIVPPYEEIQRNRINARWATELGGSRTQNLIARYNITVRTPNLEILKEQRNFSLGDPYTTSDIEVAAGEIIHYRLTVTSNGESPAYNISIDDLLSDALSYIGIISGPSAGIVTPPNPPPGATLVWDIPSLINGDTATLEFAVQFTSQPGSGENIANLAEATYETNIVNPEEYTTTSNEVDAIAPHLQLVKTASKSVVNVGDTLTYILTLTVPANVTAYDVVVSDILPPEQSYAGNAKRNFFAVTPTVIGQTVTFDLELQVGPFTEDKVIVYSFNATVDSGVAPYPQIQTDTSAVNWDTSPGGKPAGTVTSDFDVEVNEELPYRGISIADTENIDFEDNTDWK